MASSVPESRHSRARVLARVCVLCPCARRYLCVWTRGGDGEAARRELCWDEARARLPSCGHVGERVPVLSAWAQVVPLSQLHTCHQSVPLAVAFQGRDPPALILKESPIGTVSCLFSRVWWDAPKRPFLPAVPRQALWLSWPADALQGLSLGCGGDTGAAFLCGGDRVSACLLATVLGRLSPK